MVNALTVYPDLEQGSDEWLEQRRGMVTASVVGQLITLAAADPLTVACSTCSAPVGDPCLSQTRKTPTPIKTIHDARAGLVLFEPPTIQVARNDTARGLTALLVAERITGWTDPTYISDDMLRGIDDEPRAVAKYSEKYAPVSTVGFMVRDLGGGVRLGYSPDGLVGADGLVEVKSRRPKKQLQTILADAVPAENMAQLQCGLLVSGRKWIDYVSYSGGMPMWVKRVTPDPEWFAAITAAVVEFEKNAAAMVAAYETATKDLAPTERTLELEIML